MRFYLLLPILFCFGCALKETNIDNPIKITGNYEFVSMDLSFLDTLDPPVPPVLKSGEASFSNQANRFKAKFVDPVLKREIINLEGDFILRGNKIELNLPEAYLFGTIRLRERRRETHLTITWKIDGDDKLYNWIFKKRSF